MTGEQMPENLEPMLATAAKRLPGGDGWAYELKWDGVRALAFADGGGVRISARRGEDTTRRYPELAAIGEALAGREAILDGEVVAFDEHGDPSFGLLQRRMGLTDEVRIRAAGRRDPGHLRRLRPALARRPLAVRRAVRAPPRAARRARLRRPVLAGAAPPRRRRRGAVRRGRASAASRGSSPSGSASTYRPGRRSPDWVKVQNRRRQELVIGGWMPGEGGAPAPGRLAAGRLLGRDARRRRRASGAPQRLVYAGGVGTGFTEATLAELTEALAPHRARDEPVRGRLGPAGQVRGRIRERGELVWVEPVVVCEVEFLRWTHEDTVRAASFKGLRDDKDPREVVRERRLNSAHLRSPQRRQDSPDR